MSHTKTYGIVPYIVTKKGVKILLCLDVASNNKWGCLKGTKVKNETAFMCAKREFFEESSISIDIELFEEYFEQINQEKDIGVWLVNSSNIENMDRYFNGNTLKSEYLSWENSKVKFFSIDDLPRIKNKQLTLIKEITDFLRNKNQLH